MGWEEGALLPCWHAHSSGMHEDLMSLPALQQHPSLQGHVAWSRMHAHSFRPCPARTAPCPHVYVVIMHTSLESAVPHACSFMPLLLCPHSALPEKLAKKKRSWLW